MPSKVKMRRESSTSCASGSGKVSSPSKAILYASVSALLLTQVVSASSTPSWIVYPSWKSPSSPPESSSTLTSRGRATGDVPAGFSFSSASMLSHQIASRIPTFPTPQLDTDADSAGSTWTLEINELLPNQNPPDKTTPSSFVRTKKKFVMKENTALLSSRFKITEQMKLALMKGEDFGASAASSNHGTSETNSTMRNNSHGARKCQHFMGHGDGGTSSSADVAAVTSCSDGKTTGVLVSSGRYYMIYPAEESDSMAGPLKLMASMRQGRAGDDPDLPPPRHQGEEKDDQAMNSLTDDVSPHLLVLHKDDHHGGKVSLCGLKAAEKTFNMTSTSKLQETLLDVTPGSLWPGMGNSRTSDEKYVLELAVFTDAEFIKYIESRFPGDPLPHAIDVVLSFVNGVQALYDDRHLQPPLTLTVVQLDVLSSDSARVSRRDTSKKIAGHQRPADGKNDRTARKMVGGEDLDISSSLDYLDDPVVADNDIMKYLKNFCAWAAKRNPAAVKDDDSLLNNDIDTQSTLWDHAMLISGRDLTIDGDNAVMGLAWVDGMCTMEESCSVNEGRSFRSVFVMAHELAHNFGVSHDGEKGADECKDGDYIMSESDGPGKTTWSKCSKKVLAAGFRKANCLKENRNLKDDKPAGLFSESPHSSSPDDEAMKTKLFTADEQCAYAHGSSFTAVPDQDDICYDLYCTNGAKILRSHPAVEGTACGNKENKVCSEGKCTPFAALMDSKLTNPMLDEQGPIIVGSWKNLVKTSVWGKIADLMMQKRRREAANKPKEHKKDVEGAGAKPTPSSAAVPAGRATLEEDIYPDMLPASERSTSNTKSPLLMPSDVSNLIMPMSAVEWRVTKGPCSVSCGGGVRKVEATCIVTSDEDGTTHFPFRGNKKETVPHVDPSWCLDVAPPPIEGPTEACNPQPCPRGDWSLRPWGQCFPVGKDAFKTIISSPWKDEHHCGDQGIQYRSVVCKAKLPKQHYRNRRGFWPKIFSKQILMSKMSFVLKDAECPPPKPTDKRHCVVGCSDSGLLGVMAKNPVVSTIQKAVGGIVHLFKPKADSSLFVG